MTFTSKAAVVVLSLVIVCAAAHLAGAQTDPVSAANIFLYPKPYQVQDLVLKSSSGQVAALSHYKGRVVLLHFWSIRCPACRTEEPLLEGLKKAFGPAGLEVLAVNLVDPPVAVAGHAARNRLSFPVLSDGGHGFSIQPVRMGGKQTAFLVNPSQEAVLEIPALPTTYIIDCRGHAVGYSFGMAQWNHKKAVELIQNLLLQSKTCELGPSPRTSALGFSGTQN